MEALRASFFFLFFAFSLTLRADAHPLQEHYYVEGDLIEADLFVPDIDENFIIDEMQNRNRMQFSAHRIQKLFSQHGIQVEPSHPVITVSRQPEFRAAPLKEALQKAFQAHYPSMEIQSLNVRPRTYFDQGTSTLLAIDLPAPNLTKNSGTFSARYKDVEGKEKKVFFHYRLTATVQVLKAKRNLANGTILQPENSMVTTVPFKRMHAVPLDTARMGKVRIKGYVKKESILTASMVRDIPDIIKGERATLMLESGGVRVSLYATAKEDGRIGETIRFETDDGKRYRAVVTEKNKAMIQ